MPKISKTELAALVALISLSGGNASLAAQTKTTDSPESGLKPMGAVERQQSEKLGAPAACGKGICGTDAKGAKAAQEGHKGKPAAKSKKDEAAKSEKSDKPAK